MRFELLSESWMMSLFSLKSPKASLARLSVMSLSGICASMNSRWAVFEFFAMPVSRLSYVDARALAKSRAKAGLWSVTAILTMLVSLTVETTTRSRTLPKTFLSR